MKKTSGKRAADNADLLSIRVANRDGPYFHKVGLYNGDDIKKLRRRYKISQAVLARALNAGVGAVRHWEAGIRQPRGPTLKLLQILDQKGLEALL